MKIVADEQIPLVREAFADFGEIVTLPGREINHSHLKNADALFVRSVTPVTPELIAGSSLKFVASATIGIEHIDLDFLRENGIHFAFAPGSNANSVAQYIVSALVRIAEKSGRTLQEMTLGIVGVGNIGTLVHSYAIALGMRCTLNDPPKKRLSNNEIYRSLEEVLEASDVITMHVPLNKSGPDQTFRMVNREFFGRMKTGAVLINTSRGKVVDEQALKDLRGKLAVLILDVWDNEPLVDLSLVRLSDIATPHIAGYSYDGKINGVAMIHRAASTFFGVSSKWNAADYLQENAGTIDCTGSFDPVFEAISKAFSLEKDDLEFKKIIAMPDPHRGAYFDRLRSEYPKRLEFSHYTVRYSEKQQAAASVLKKLGFRTVLDG